MFLRCLAAFCVLFLAWRPSVAAGEKPKTRILLIGKDPDHPFGSHMYMHTCSMLAKCLELSPNIQAVVSNGWPKDDTVLKNVKAIVVYTSPAAELLLDGPHREAFEKLMKSGAGLVTIHWASSVYQKNLERLGPAWIGYLGGTWVSNVGLGGGKSPLRQLVADHPICRGWSDWEIDDEYYLNPTIGKKATPLLKVTESKGKEVIVGWALEREGGGRSFGTTLGHPYVNFQKEPFRRMIVNAILWSAQADVPAKGAPVNLSEEDLALPKKSARDARQTVEAYLAAVIAGKIETAAGLAMPGSTEGSKERIGEYREMIAAKAVKVASAHVSATQGRAFAVTEVVPLAKAQRDGADKATLIVKLTLHEGSWRVRDLDFRTADIAQTQLQDFLKKFADAKQLPAGEK